MSYLKPLKLSIRFGDNDFNSTFLNLLKHLGTAYKENRIEYTLEQYVEIINKLSLGFYLLHQNNFRYNCSEAEISHIEKYLKITKEMLSFDNKIEWDNSETFNLYSDEHTLLVYSN